ncbi:DUF4340 domain-containing protein [Myxococcus llanfairpwllgwyngyllgogerychwyrndrobwllllantysiliogogogochensis]|uniref:DUF4340 domain-containing protein n=1 Tax=Myxococcus llanfairpwllgwyngyllgogerychwyrndrobwllllantysiliogogogochensis TaxID=2590453 RepID=A0A540WWU7_9BACT|nr:DUF4340 domain-containing protein [Myxococcus llanfairpwllgwyngyllgogerychwyrndrobwllllantysiliogogogochensis]TQF13479.1 DUF4340 domain-containing protein [Myxococcus llanfairpwllgwyngyllgogerychwyrndrobwllllantysiliogogogochensis]
MSATGKGLVTVAVLALGAGGLTLSACSDGTSRRGSETPAVSEKLFAPPSGATQGAKAAAPVFTRITVRAQGDTTELAREPDGAWQLVAPVKARAEAAAVEALLETLGSTASSPLVNDAPTDADLEKYGLKSPVFSVTAHAFLPDASGGGEDVPSRQHTVTLHGGVENTFDGSVYVRRDGDSKVYAAQGSVRWSLDKDTFALRSKELLGGLEATALASIEVRAQERSYVLQHETGTTKWRLTKPVAERADEARVATLLKNLKEHRALAFPPDSAQTRKKLGLESPLVDARFTPLSGEPVRIRLAQVMEDGTPRSHALREQGPDAVLAEVSDGALTVLDVDVHELKDKHVLSFRREDVRRVVFHPGGGAAPIILVNASETDGGTESWRVESPKQGKAQHFRVVSLLRALGALKATSFGDAKPRSWAKYGIDEASRGAVLLGADGRELARLWLGGDVPDSSGLSYVRGSGPEVMEVSIEGLVLPVRAEDLMEGAPAPEPTEARGP